MENTINYIPRSSINVSIPTELLIALKKYSNSKELPVSRVISEFVKDRLEAKQNE